MHRATSFLSSCFFVTFLKNTGFKTDIFVFVSKKMLYLQFFKKSN